MLRALVKDVKEHAPKNKETMYHVCSNHVQDKSVISCVAKTNEHQFYSS